MRACNYVIYHITCHANLSLFEFLEQVSMSGGEMLCQVGCVGSLGLCGFKTSFTDGLALTVGYISEIMPNFAPCVYFVNKPRTWSARALVLAAIPLVLSP